VVIFAFQPFALGAGEFW